MRIEGIHNTWKACIFAVGTTVSDAFCSIEWKLIAAKKLYSFHPCGSVMPLLPFLTVQGFKLYSNTGHWRAIIHQLYTSTEEVWCTPMIEVTSQQLGSEKEEPETKDPEL